MTSPSTHRHHTPKPLLLLLVVLVVSSLPTATRADTVELAECPKEPNVVGVYVNNGKNCVRERTEVARDVVSATCKSGWELVTQDTFKAYCRVKEGSNTPYNKADSFPKCPVDYQRYGRQCHSSCPRGYNSKRGKCIQLKDTMPQHSMTCSNPTTHRIGAFCCETDQCGDLIQQRHEDRIQKMKRKHAKGNDSVSMTKMAPPPSSLTECNLPQVPGRFYYNALTGNCDRSRISEPRVWTKLPRDKKNQYIGSCDSDTETKVLGGCQPKCPPHYKSQKGMCHLPPCSIPFTNDSKEQQRNNNGIILCPEGKYYLSSQSI